MSNKTRVFVAVYTRPTASDSSTISASKSRPTAQKYHWGLWLEPKGSNGNGTSFDLEDAAAYSSVSSPFGWRLHFDEHKSLPSHMLGRVMIGKMVEGSTEADVANVLMQVQMPCEAGSPVGDAVEWIKRVIYELQEMGCAEMFSIDAFMEEALSHAITWHGKKGRKEPEKVNFTWSRTFP
ncbi:hypothetical protein P171DRAFT_35168 [Karstenula rhodostoma CBS 690.94]|uniref:Uncharacterized protein n=1 Tax=Karstenula rhodostoma CBS 690.94 TaxID=1392251 RepID=A0A9P4PHX9_9PLEO|nr:hypothetical protein P171DRAFT_35168 [Karstenula rhodostoma CBS 690.94]